MSTLTDAAEAMSGFSTFLTSTLGTGLISFFVFQSKSCSGGELGGTAYSCTNVFGDPPFTTEAAGTFGTVTGFALGAIALGIREFILERARKRGEIA